MRASRSLADVVHFFPAVWLRDNCPCPRCRDPDSGQKLIGLLDLPEELSFEVADDSGDSITLRFSPDGHVATFSGSWLLEQLGPPEGDGRGEADKWMWEAADLTGSMPVSSWSSYEHDAAVKVRTLESVDRLGFAILRGVPTTDGAVLAVAQTFGYVRETNYGRLFDVRAEVHPNNLAFTGLAIAPHTDNPYRDPVPTLQLLHCLSNAVEGGESGLVDGFEAASVLRDEDEASFLRLADTPVGFAWSGGRVTLRAERPIIDVDALRRIRGVRLNHRSMQTVRLPTSELPGFYSAYRRFTEIVFRPELQVTFRLEPGDCLIFDNVRVLHSRTAFSDGATGRRHLQGCYADTDGLLSTIAALRG